MTHDNEQSVWVVDVIDDEETETIAAFTSEADAEAYMLARDEDGRCWGATLVPLNPPDHRIEYGLGRRLGERVVLELEEPGDDAR